jgi:hypothetical protein
MRKRWHNYENGIYRLGQLNGEAVVTWPDEATGKRHRRRLGVFTKAEGRSAVDTFALHVKILTAGDNVTVGVLFQAYIADREKDGRWCKNSKTIGRH